MITRSSFIRFVAPGMLIMIAAIQPYACHGRFYNTIHWMNAIPQSAYANPALMPLPDMYVGPPGLSSLYMNITNSGYALGDLIVREGNQQRTWDTENFHGRMRRYNASMADLHVDLIGFGFRMDRNYFSVSVTEKIGAKIGHTSDLARLVTMGSMDFAGNESQGRLNDLALQTMHYREAGVSMSREVSASLVLGVRTKILFGLAGASMVYSRLTMYPDPINGEVLVEADMLINTATAEGFVNGDNGENQPAMPGINNGYLANWSNRGLAIDAGMVYKPLKNLSLSVSMLDLGFISWKSQVENHYITGVSDFNGINLQDLFEGDVIENVNTLADTLNLPYSSDSEYDVFRTILPAAFMASVAWDIDHRQQIALLTHARFFNNRVYPTAGFSYHFRPWDTVGLAMSYSLVHLSHSNIGLGIFANLGPVQLYLISDNVLAPWLPYRAQLVNLHAGLNILIGQPSHKKNLPPGLRCW